MCSDDDIRAIVSRHSSSSITAGRRPNTPSSTTSSSVVPPRRTSNHHHQQQQHQRTVQRQPTALSFSSRRSSRTSSIDAGPLSATGTVFTSFDSLPHSAAGSCCGGPGTGRLSLSSAAGASRTPSPVEIGQPTATCGGSSPSAAEQPEAEEGATAAAAATTAAAIAPREVVFDEQGQTWDVYGAEFDPAILGRAIQSHLERIINDNNRLASSSSSQQPPPMKQLVEADVHRSDDEPEVEIESIIDSPLPVTTSTKTTGDNGLTSSKNNLAGLCFLGHLCASVR